MRIIVTGGAGFIGTNLVRYLLVNTAHSITCIDKLTYAANPQLVDEQALLDRPAKPGISPGKSPAGRYRLVRADVADASALAEILEQVRPDAVIHLAAESHVDRSVDDPSDFIHTNIYGTYSLLNESLRYWSQLSGEAKASFRFLHVSTDEVYGSLGDTGMFTESTAYDPQSPYAASKAASDHLASAWHQTYRLPVIITNCSNNYGPYQFPEKLIPHIIVRAVRGKSLPVYGNGANVRDWLYVEDHVRALYTALQSGRPGERYNIGANGERRNIDLIEELCGILDECQPRRDEASYREQIEFVVDRPGHDYRYAIDSSKLRNELGWKPEYSVSRGLRCTVKWYLENSAWWLSVLAKGYDLERLGSSHTLQQGGTGKAGDERYAS